MADDQDLRISKLRISDSKPPWNIPNLRLSNQSLEDICQKDQAWHQMSECTERTPSLDCLRSCYTEHRAWLHINPYLRDPTHGLPRICSDTHAEDNPSHENCIPERKTCSRPRRQLCSLDALLRSSSTQCRLFREEITRMRCNSSVQGRICIQYHLSHWKAHWVLHRHLPSLPHLSVRNRKQGCDDIGRNPRSESA